MKLVTYDSQGIQSVGILEGEWVYPTGYGSLLELIRAQKPAQKIGQALAKGQVQILAPIPHPQQDIICLGVNYMAHAQESARFKKEDFNGERPYAVYFSKRVDCALEDGGTIPSYPGLVDSLDYEVELAAIIGRDAKAVRQEDAWEHVFGYTILNDVSARNVQNRHKQWYFGKSMDGFCPMGPCVVTREEFAFPPALEIYSRVNGELRQQANTRDMIFDLPFVIAELSQSMTLRAGTVIATGTPAGAGMGFTPPKWLRPGDLVECGIEGIGVLRNRVGG